MITTGSTPFKIIPTDKVFTPYTPVVWTVAFGEIFVPEQLAALFGQEAVEAIPTHKVQVLAICLEQTALVRTFTEHVSLPI